MAPAGQPPAAAPVAPPASAGPASPPERRNGHHRAAEPPPSNEHRVAGTGRRAPDRSAADSRSAAPARGTATRTDPPRVAGAPKTNGQARTNGSARAIAMTEPVSASALAAAAAEVATSGLNAPLPKQAGPRDKPRVAGTPSQNGRVRPPRQPDQAPTADGGPAAPPAPPVASNNGAPPPTNGTKQNRRPRPPASPPGTATGRRPAGTGRAPMPGPANPPSQNRMPRPNGAPPASDGSSRRLPIPGNDASSRRLPIPGNNGRPPQGPPSDGPPSGAPIGNRLNPDVAGDALDGQRPDDGMVDDAVATSAAEAPPPMSRRPRPPRKPGEPERREDIDPASLTAEMEPISEMVVQKRKVDATLARFSAVHDEMVAEEEERRTRRKRLMPWLAKDDDLEEALSSKNVATTVAKPVSEPDKQDELPKGGSGVEAADGFGAEGAGRPDADAFHPHDHDPAGFDPAFPHEATQFHNDFAEAPGFPEDDFPEVDHHEPDLHDGDFHDADLHGEADLPPTDESGGPAKAASSPRDKRLRWGLRGLAIAAAVAVLALTGIEWSTQTTDNNQIQTIAALDENSPAIANGAKQSGDENFLFVGTNARAGVSNGSITTDSVLVAHIPADRSRVEVVSFPGNLAVTRPACQTWDNASSSYSSASKPAQDGVRLDAIYAVGGPRCVTDTVQELSGLRINHFVGMDFQGFTDLAGALPPISLCTKGSVVDSQLGTIIGQGGQTTLSAQQALNFVRADHVQGDAPGQYAKIARQQRFLAAVLRQVIGQSMLTSPSKLNSLLSVFSKSTFGANMDVSALITLAQSLQGVNLNQITFITLPTTGSDNAQGEATPVTDESTQLFNAIIGNAPLPGASSNGSASSSPLTPQGIKIQVLNGGDTQQGAANQTAQALKQQGFSVVNGGNSHAVDATVIKYATADKAKAELLGSAVPKATLQEDDSANGAVELILGPNFDGKVVQAQSGGGNAPANSGTGNSPSALSTLTAADTSCA